MSSSTVQQSSVASPDADLDQLITEARAGSTTALETLLEMLSAQLWSELDPRRRPQGLGPSTGLSDLIQDTLVRVREKFERFERGSFVDFAQWARTILYRRRQELARKFRVRNDAVRREEIGWLLRARLERIWRLDRQDSRLEWREEAARAFAAFRSLKPHEQFVLGLRAVEGLHYPQIEAMTGWTREAARQAYRRALQQLKSRFEQTDRP